MYRKVFYQTFYLFRTFAALFKENKKYTFVCLERTLAENSVFQMSVKK